MRYWISDTHWNHANIIKYCKRPFGDVHEMNREMVRRWNEVVTPEDWVVHVGDFSLGTYADMRGILKRLHGKKLLIRGNHDKTPSQMEEAGFDFCLESMTMKLQGVGKVLVSHEPLRPTVALKEILNEISAVIQIHGHTHNNEGPDKDPWRVNLSVENWDYTPISEETLIRTIQSRIKSR